MADPQRLNPRLAGFSSQELIWELVNRDAALGRHFLTVRTMGHDGIPEVAKVGLQGRGGYEITSPSTDARSPR